MPTSSRSRRPWLVVGTVWVTLAIASGLYFSFPVFFVALLEEFGWSRGATAAAFSISSVVQGALSPMIGILVDRLGPRRVMLGGGTLAVLVPLIWFGVREAPIVTAPARAAAEPTPAPARRDVGDALRTGTFWALFFAYLCTPLAVFSVVTHSVAFAVDHGFP